MSQHLKGKTPSAYITCMHAHTAIIICVTIHLALCVVLNIEITLNTIALTCNADIMYAIHVYVVVIQMPLYGRK